MSDAQALELAKLLTVYAEAYGSSSDLATLTFEELCEDLAGTLPATQEVVDLFERIAAAAA